MEKVTQAMVKNPRQLTGILINFQKELGELKVQKLRTRIDTVVGLVDELQETVKEVAKSNDALSVEVAALTEKLIGLDRLDKFAKAMLDDAPTDKAETDEAKETG